MTILQAFRNRLARPWIRTPAGRGLASPRFDARRSKGHLCRMTDVSFPPPSAPALSRSLSPCVLPLAAPYLCYLAGASVEALVDEGEAKARRDILLTALLFVAGFTTVFVGLGATASAFGADFQAMEPCAIDRGRDRGDPDGPPLFRRLQDRLGDARQARSNRKASPALERLSDGVAFALGWTPCIGPIWPPFLRSPVAAKRSRAAQRLFTVPVIGLGAALHSRRRS